MRDGKETYVSSLLGLLSRSLWYKVSNTVSVPDRLRPGWTRRSMSHRRQIGRKSKGGVTYWIFGSVDMVGGYKKGEDGSWRTVFFST